MFSVDILINKRYNAPVNLFKNFDIFSGQLTLNHVSLRHNTDSQRYVEFRSVKFDLTEKVIVGNNDTLGFFFWETVISFIDVMKH